MRFCDYVYDENSEIGIDLGDCLTCLREKERTCPTGIYMDTEVEFPSFGDPCRADNPANGGLKGR